MCFTCFAERSTMTLTPYSVFDLFCREVHDNIDTLQCVWPVLQRGPRWRWHLTMCLTCFAERSTMTLTTYSMFGLFCSEVQDDRDPLPSDLAVWRGGESQVLPVPLPAVPMQAGDPARTATADGGLQHPERHQGPGQHRPLLGRSVHDRFPANIPDPIRIRSGSAGKHWPEAGRMTHVHRLASGPDPCGQNLTQSARTKSDPGWFGTVLSRTSVEERNRVWKWETGSGPVASCQKPGQMIPAHRLAARPDAFGQILTRPSRSDPCLFCTIWSMPSLEKRNWNGCRKSDPAYTIRPDSGCTLAVMATTGRNQTVSGSDPACLPGTVWHELYIAGVVNCCNVLGFLCLWKPSSFLLRNYPASQISSQSSFVGFSDQFPELRCSQTSPQSLSGSQLRSQSLSGSQLSFQSLSGSQLSSQSLSGSQLSSQSLSGSQLSSQNLSGSQLSSQSLLGSQLSSQSLLDSQTGSQSCDAALGTGPRIRQKSSGSCVLLK